ncbi:MAG: hypothetical protein FGM24_10395, partial [Candidatus Kapabacteria bacterium]|nr:hypothetical protein [Candidatus Kapabacteria bacterium]
MISRVLMTLLSMLVATSLYAQTTYYVRDGGDDAADGLTPGTALATIQAAVNLANMPGDVVDVGPGNFDGAALNYDATIFGANAYTPWDQWGPETRITSSFIIGGFATVVLEGLTFDANMSPLGYNYYYGYPNRLTISNCLFDESYTTDIYNINEVVVAGNRFNGYLDRGTNAATGGLH